MIYLRFIDTCLPDYFPGCDVPYLQVPAYSDMTYADLRDALEESAREILDEDVMPDFMDALDAGLEPSDNYVIQFSYLPSSDDVDEPIYCYIAVIIEK